jgi:hypothetical protein
MVVGYFEKVPTTDEITNYRFPFWLDDPGGEQRNRTSQAASSRPTLGKRAQYPHWKCPPKPAPAIRFTLFLPLGTWM